MRQEIALVRREFLRSGAIAGGALVIGTLEGCKRQSAVVNRQPYEVRRPLLFRRGPRTVAILQEPPEAPVSYFDKQLGKIYVAPEYRDRVIQLIKATVNKDGIWSFSVGDNAKQEASEEQYHEWDPTKDPSEGSVRTVERECVDVTFKFDCVPVLGSKPPVWWKCDPLTHGQCVGERRRLCTEVYKVVGQCNDYSDPACTTQVGQSDILNWFCLEL